MGAVESRKKKMKKQAKNIIKKNTFVQKKPNKDQGGKYLHATVKLIQYVIFADQNKH